VAYDAIAPGGTLLICSGRHTLAGLTISKPITITSVTPLGATLELESVGFVIDGVTSGLVRVTGINFELAPGATFAQTAVFASPSWDRVEVVGNVFRMPGATFGNAMIQAGPGSLASSAMLIENNQFIGGVYAVSSIGPETDGTTAPVVTVRGNTFSAQHVAGVLIQRRGGMALENNSFTGCGQLACVAAFDAGPITASANTMIASGSSLAAFYLTGSMAPAGTALVATNNTITGTVGDGSAPASYGFSDAAFWIMLQAPSAQSVQLTGNQVTNAWTGLKIDATGPAGDVFSAQSNTFNGVRNGVVYSWTGSATSLLSLAITGNTFGSTVAGITSNVALSAGALGCNTWAGGVPTVVGPVLAAAWGC
jgi:hypothetical protein